MTDERPPAPEWPERIIELYPGSRQYRCPAPNGSYHVDLVNETCTCSHFCYRLRPGLFCKHLDRAVAYELRLDWERDMTPILAARAARLATGEKTVPAIEGLTNDELLAIFA
jgi:hypothetical protein